MAARRMMLPDYGTVSMKGTQYYRTRVTDQQGRRVPLYARTREELYQKEQEAIQQIENKTYRRSTPTVEEYCEKWLLLPWYLQPFLDAHASQLLILRHLLTEFYCFLSGQWPPAYPVQTPARATFSGFGRLPARCRARGPWTKVGSQAGSRL